MKEYATGQEPFLMDAAVTITKPDNISVEQAAALGVDSQTAALSIFDGLKIQLFDPAQNSAVHDERVIVLGGGSSAGSYAIQILEAARYHVLASCSQRSNEAVKGFGAEVFDYKTPIEQQIDDVLRITNGNITGISDAAATDDPVLAKKLFSHSSWSSNNRYFATTNDWSGIGDFEGGKTYELDLGLIGRPDSSQLNEKLASHIPIIVGLVKTGKLKPNEYEVIGKGGLEDVITAFEHKSGGTSRLRKTIVKIQDE